jgi:hypothetical protein
VDYEGFVAKVIEIIKAARRALMWVAADDLEEWRPIYLFVEI